MKSNISKFLFGTFYFFIFLLIVLVSILLYGSSKFSFADLSNSIKNLFSVERILDGKPLMLTKEVVQEESVVTNVVEEVSPSVVSIIIKTYDFDIFDGPSSKESGIGTGFVVDSSGLIITNSHVVGDPEGEYSVVTKDGETYDVDKIHLDEATDIAILEITARNLPAVKFGDSDSLKVGQKAIAIGNALGQFQNTVTVGVVSGISRQIVATGGAGQPSKIYESVIQTDAALNPGNSGGPLLDSFGQVIGVNVATTTGAENISFAIPINSVKPILEVFLREGKIVRPYMGVYYSMISKEISRIRDLPEGAFVSRVVADSPAMQAGIKRGDILVEVEGQPLSSERSLISALSKFKVGDTIKIKIDRNGSEVILSVTLGEVPSEE
ncbi:hypothetical protein A2415_03655 [candidate division WWE3 bacterium RIFOXYC1_FULL_39_7]|uniref:PDZ domain-containing protein n=2 Tax=Katanobacteria TaxID=422282 RepID=A0A1F4X7S1_UNCKA|nr:MAG: hypothetical protein A2415_03655 [candidate division WWE3 bacterium RIFOXYC1_FULL_39_7]OGC77702.1 MAG: hypothetical protein A2619_03280 [candidate division WWE3 bacterium RIFOXYD1_FULL_39_9]